jgi:hypothetical protein
VYVLVAPEPDRQHPHKDDEVYVVLEGTGVLTIEGQAVEPEGVVLLLGRRGQRLADDRLTGCGLRPLDPQLEREVVRAELGVVGDGSVLGAAVQADRRV